MDIILKLKEELNVEKEIDKKQAEIQARRENGGK